MAQYLDVKLKCEISITKSESVHLSLYLDSVLLQFCDITNVYKELVETNTEYEIYDNDAEMLGGLETGYLHRYLERDFEDERLDALVSLRVDMLHRSKKCGGDCILCNPNLGPDPFPDFLFYLNAINPEGEA